MRLRAGCGLRASRQGLDGPPQTCMVLSGSAAVVYGFVCLSVCLSQAVTQCKYSVLGNVLRQKDQRPKRQLLEGTCHPSEAWAVCKSVAEPRLGLVSSAPTQPFPPPHRAVPSLRCPLRCPLRACAVPARPRGEGTRRMGLLRSGAADNWEDGTEQNRRVENRVGRRKGDRPRSE